MKIEKRRHKTPSGGDRSVAYYKDENGELVDKGQAKTVEIVEYRGSQEISRTYGLINDNQPTAT